MLQHGGNQCKQPTGARCPHTAATPLLPSLAIRLQVGLCMRISSRTHACQCFTTVQQSKPTAVKQVFEFKHLSRTAQPPPNVAKLSHLHTAETHPAVATHQKAINTRAYNCMCTLHSCMPSMHGRTSAQQLMHHQFASIPNTCQSPHKTRWQPALAMATATLNFTPFTAAADLGSQ